MTVIQLEKPALSRMGAPVSLVLIAGAYINGYFHSFSDWYHETTLAGLPISLLDVIVIVVAARLIAADRPGAAHAPGFAEAAVAALVLLPSGALSLSAACGYASWCAFKARSWARAGFALLAALAAAQLWTDVFIKWFALSLGTADAYLACGVLTAAFKTCTRQDNVFGFVRGHSIIVLYGCSAASFLPKLLLVQAAALFDKHEGKPVCFAIAIGLVLSFALAANSIRLALMTVSPDYYQTIHSSFGGGVFDLLMVLCVYAITSRMRHS